MGAWIETFMSGKDYQHGSSHPTWVRGLKLVVDFARFLLVVAPYVGAWIETADVNDVNKQDDKSHPTWVRGLKLFLMSKVTKSYSRTLRGCVD